MPQGMYVICAPAKMLQEKQLLLNLGWNLENSLMEQIWGVYKHNKSRQTFLVGNLQYTPEN